MSANNYRATKIGAVFTVVSIALTFTYLVPVITVGLAGIFFERLAAAAVTANEIGKVTTLMLAIVLVLVLAPMFYAAWRVARKGCVLSKGEIISYMLLLYFIVHPLGFYMYWGMALHYRMDGQLIFASLISFPFSSLFFLAFCFVLDVIANYTENTAHA